MMMMMKLHLAQEILPLQCVCKMYKLRQIGNLCKRMKDCIAKCTTCEKLINVQALQILRKDDDDSFEDG